jgi:hypothetical protein
LVFLKIFLPKNPRVPQNLLDSFVSRKTAMEAPGEAAAAAAGENPNTAAARQAEALRRGTQTSNGILF